MKNRSCLMLAILGVLSLGIAACGGGNSTGQAASVSSAAETVKAENDSVDEPAAETDGKGSAKESADAEVSAPAASGDDTSDSGSAEAELWDSDEEFTYDYGEDAVLYNANGVRIRARRLIYKSTDKGMKLSVNANIQNNTDGIIQTKGDWVTDTDNSAGGSKSDPQRDRKSVV